LFKNFRFVCLKISDLFFYDKMSIHFLLAVVHRKNNTINNTRKKSKTQIKKNEQIKIIAKNENIEPRILCTIYPFYCFDSDNENSDNENSDNENNTV